MTKPIEKTKKRKRNPPRGILTPTEEERLRKGNINRQTVYNIRRKTLKTIMTDLPLIFEKFGIERLKYDMPSKQFFKNLLQVYFDLTKKQMINERLQRGVKGKVSSKKVWSRIQKEIEDT